MAWRVEWTGGTGEGSPPVGWIRFDDRDHARSFALETLRRDADADLRIVWIEVVEGAEVDADSVAPSVATLITWAVGETLPRPSRHARAARHASREDVRREAIEGLRTVLDHVVDCGELSRGEAARIVAMLAAAMIRSASAAAE